MATPGSLLTPLSLLSFSGAVIAAALIPNVLATLVTLPPRVLRVISLVVSLVLAGLMAYMSDDGAWINWIVAFFNGLIIYLSALGANETLSHASKDEFGELMHSAVAKEPPKRPFFASWF